MAEKSAGKDTTTGHWELAGVCLEKAFPTFPNGFPTEIITEFERRVGRKTLCNRPYSGTEVIKDYGEEHCKTGALIVYTSADSVFQIAAHEDVVPLSELYHACEIARTLLTDEFAVGRVIARPFAGAYPFYRTANRHDYSLVPPRTLLNELSEAGLAVHAVGKINDIFAGQGITATYPTKGNKEGMQVLSDLTSLDFEGLCFVNLVDFDMLYGHRNDADGYARALNEFDCFLGEFLPQLKKEDVLIVTADHGCDPATASTDHSREYVPILACGVGVCPDINIGTRCTFSDVSATILAYFGISHRLNGTSFWEEVQK